MKAILMSIRPEWVAKILNGEKTIEIRKAYPKCDLPIDVYIYCTKGKEHIYREFNGKIEDGSTILNGKVVAKFTLNKVETIKLPYTYFGTNKWVSGEHARTLQTKTMDEEDLLKASCVSEDEIYKYLNFKHSPEQVGYAWHIDNLVIFDKPKEINEFKIDITNKVEWAKDQTKLICKYRRLTPLTRAPQSYCYIEKP